MLLGGEKSRYRLGQKLFEDSHWDARARDVKQVLCRGDISQMAWNWAERMLCEASGSSTVRCAVLSCAFHACAVASQNGFGGVTAAAFVARLVVGWSKRSAKWDALIGATAGSFPKRADVEEEARAVAGSEG